jgi:hypothetical protein
MKVLVWAWEYFPPLALAVVIVWDIGRWLRNWWGFKCVLCRHWHHLRDRAFDDELPGACMHCWVKIMQGWR